jgi:phosphoglycolate phosphatase-like HAD superfamily hydrolase
MTTMKRLILFDIDGTLLSTDGAARRAFHRAMLEVYGTAGPIATHPFDGKTDPQIARELLAIEGRDATEIDAGFESLWLAYLRELEQELQRPAHKTTLYPGVTGLLQALNEHAHHTCLALLTGNIARGAELKLRSAGLYEHFRFGAFGSDCERRDGLPAVAVQRAFEHTQHRFSGRDIIVIGDTPQDVTCGASLGVFTIAVATGRHTRAELEHAGADIVLQDLSDTGRVLDLVLGPA